jgi:ABC-type polysaccharide/polyol phosphate export permease
MSSQPLASAVRELPDGWVHRTPTRTYTEGAQRGRRTTWVTALAVLTRHEFKARYRAQSLGLVWSLLNPIIMMGILSVVFARVGASWRHSQVQMLIGLIVWQFISNASMQSTGAFITHAEILKRTVFPRQLLPLAVMLSWGINFCIESCVLFLFIPIYPDSYQLTPALLLIPVVIGLLVLFLAGVALAAAALNVLYRDVAYLVQTALALLYWLTPVFYPIDVVDGRYQALLKCSPFAGVINALRGIITEGRPPSVLMWASIALPAAVMLGAGYLVFRRYERMVLDRV